MQTVKVPRHVVECGIPEDALIAPLDVLERNHAPDAERARAIASDLCRAYGYNPAGPLRRFVERGPAALDDQDAHVCEADAGELEDRLTGISYRNHCKARRLRLYFEGLRHA